VDEMVHVLNGCYEWSLRQEHEQGYSAVVIDWGLSSAGYLRLARDIEFSQQKLYFSSPSVVLWHSALTPHSNPRLRFRILLYSLILRPPTHHKALQNARK
jgi:hypothetical protein